MKHIAETGHFELYIWCTYFRNYRFIPAHNWKLHITNNGLLGLLRIFENPIKSISRYNVSLLN